MQTISVGQLRRYPTDMLNDGEADETYAINRNHCESVRIVPSDQPLTVIPAKYRRGTGLASVPRHELRRAASMDDLLAGEHER